MDVSVRIGSLFLKNPVMVASGTFGYGKEYEGLIDINRLGAVVTKGISLKPSNGNPPPRIIETPAGMLNAIGLENVGLDAFIADKMPYLRQFSTPVIVNIYGTSIADYAALAERLSDVEGVSALEANISCPNVKEGGICFGTDPAMAHRTTTAIRAKTKLPLLVKLSPNVSDIGAIAQSVAEAGADALCLCNTFTGMVVDTATCRPALANITGGLSGPAIRPLALRMVWETVKRVSLPVVGIGGIMDAGDALQFLITGACAVQVGTGLFANPKAPHEIVEGIEAYLRGRGCSAIGEITGTLQTEAGGHSSSGGRAG